MLDAPIQRNIKKKYFTAISITTLGGFFLALVRRLTGFLRTYVRT